MRAILVPSFGKPKIPSSRLVLFLLLLLLHHQHHSFTAHLRLIITADKQSQGVWIAAGHDSGNVLRVCRRDVVIGEGIPLAVRLELVHSSAIVVGDRRRVGVV